MCKMLFLATTLSAILVTLGAQATDYYLDPAGNDAATGTSPDTAWHSLEKASACALAPGDQVLLKRGGVFPGTLHLHASGSEAQPIRIDAYGDASAAPPRIDARGHLAGLYLDNCAYIEAANLEITADAGEVKDREARDKRFGIYAVASQEAEHSRITLDNLTIHDIFASREVEGDGQNPTSNMGMGVRFDAQSGAFFSGINIKNCAISRTGHTGIKINCSNPDPKAYNSGIQILDNTLEDIGGPGIQPGRAKHIVVRGNTVNRSGSSADPRMHARGSGIWPWTCQDVLIEKNKFMHARGKADSCGAHIDFNCSDVVVQYNLSLDNEGGFVEILGNCHNCAYRYNISINDGFRVKGENGAHQAGKMLWLSGYTGRGQKRTGPFNSYIYNNTVYVKPEIRANYAFASTSEGALIANNIFYITGETANVEGDQETSRESANLSIPNAVFTNNLYLKSNTPPAGLPLTETHARVADPQFKKPGGEAPADYLPANIAAIQNQGITIAPLPGDPIGLKIGLAVEQDFFGIPITGQPDLGAVELLP